MRCEEVKRILGSDDLEIPDPEIYGLIMDALEHAETCPPCAIWLDELEQFGEIMAEGFASSIALPDEDTERYADRILKTLEEHGFDI